MDIRLEPQGISGSYRTYFVTIEPSLVRRLNGGVFFDGFPQEGSFHLTFADAKALSDRLSAVVKATEEARSAPVHIAVEIPGDRREEAAAALAALGGKVIA